MVRLVANSMLFLGPLVLSGASGRARFSKPGEVVLRGTTCYTAKSEYSIREGRIVQIGKEKFFCSPTGRI